MVRQKVFSERLTELMNRYTNQQLTAAEVLASWPPSRATWSPRCAATCELTGRHEDVRAAQPLRPDYAESAGALTAASLVVAINFATVAQANNYWR